MDYDAESNPALASFAIRFGKETTMVGYPKARLWVESEGADDMDLFILVQKLDRNGTPLQQFNVPNHGALIQDQTERGASVLRYKGSNGRLRVSARHLDETLTTDAVPAHSFDRVEKLSTGEIVDVEIDLFPIGLVFYPGEQLRLVISAQNALGAIMPATRITSPKTVESTSSTPAGVTHRICNSPSRPPRRGTAAAGVTPHNRRRGSSPRPSVLPRQVSKCQTVKSPACLNDIGHVSNSREDGENSLVVI